MKSPAISIRKVVSGEDSDTVQGTDNLDEPEELKDGNGNSETPFSQDDLIVKWKEYADLLQPERPRMAIILRNREPLLGDDYRINLLMDNAAQLEEFNHNIRSGLLEFLKRELKNSFITIQDRIEQNENGKKVLYTPEERFQYLSKKNPALNKLRQQFNLDFE